MKLYNDTFEEDYGQFIEIDIESLEVIYKKPPPHTKIQQYSYIQSTVIHTIYAVVIYFFHSIHGL